MRSAGNAVRKRHAQPAAWSGGEIGGIERSVRVAKLPRLGRIAVLLRGDVVESVARVDEIFADECECFGLGNEAPADVNNFATIGRCISCGVDAIITAARIEWRGAHGRFWRPRLPSDTGAAFAA